MPTVGRRSREVIEEQFPEITWHHSHVVVDEEGAVKSFCVYDAPTPEAIRKTAARNELPVDHITQIRVLDPYFYVGSTA